MIAMWATNSTRVSINSLGFHRTSLLYAANSNSCVTSVSISIYIMYKPIPLTRYRLSILYRLDYIINQHCFILYWFPRASISLEMYSTCLFSMIFLQRYTFDSRCALLNNYFFPLEKVLPRLYPNRLYNSISLGRTFMSFSPFVM